MMINPETLAEPKTRNHRNNPFKTSLLLEVKQELRVVLGRGTPIPRKVLLESVAKKVGVSQRWVVQGLDELRVELGQSLEVISLGGRGKPITLRLIGSSNPTVASQTKQPLNPLDRSSNKSLRKTLVDRLHQMGATQEQLAIAELLGLEHLGEQVRLFESNPPSIDLWQFIQAVYWTVRNPSTSLELRENLTSVLEYLLSCPQDFAQQVISRPEHQALARQLKARLNPDKLSTNQ